MPSSIATKTVKAIEHLGILEPVYTTVKPTYKSLGFKNVHKDCSLLSDSFFKDFSI